MPYERSGSSLEHCHTLHGTAADNAINNQSLVLHSNRRVHYPAWYSLRSVEDGSTLATCFSQKGKAIMGFSACQCALPVFMPIYRASISVARRTTKDVLAPLCYPHNFFKSQWHCPSPMALPRGHCHWPARAAMNNWPFVPAISY